MVDGFTTNSAHPADVCTACFVDVFLHVAFVDGLFLNCTDGGFCSSLQRGGFEPQVGCFLVYLCVQMFAEIVLLFLLALSPAVEFSKF